jgi:hypothetical protein
MIAKQTTGAVSSSGKMVDYALRENGLKHPDEKVDIIFQNSCFYSNHTEIKEQMKMALELNKGKCKMPMFHAIFSLAENERLTKEQEFVLSEKLVKEFKLENSIVLGVKHTSSENKDHYHFIICLPPIDGKAVPNMFKSKMRLMEISRACELEFGLKKVETPKIEKGKQHSKNNERFDKAKSDLRKALVGTKSMAEFILKMNKAGYSLHKGRGLGIVENATGIYYKASNLGLSLQKIEKIINFNQGLERQVNNQPFKKDRHFELNNNSSSNDISSKSHEQSSSNFIDNLLFALGRDMGGGGSYHGGSPSPSESEEEERKRKRKKKYGFSR